LTENGQPRKTGEVSKPISQVSVLKRLPAHLPANIHYLLWQGDTERLIDRALAENMKFNLIITSPPYNLGKEYEVRTQIDEYLAWQSRIIQKTIGLMAPSGSICWQVGNYVENGSIEPLDLLLHHYFSDQGLRLRNRIIWHFGHGLHCQKRFSGRYEVVLWYTNGDDYVFNLDAVRVPSKYPRKKYFKGPRAGQYSSNPLGKNPEDVWDNIPNVKANHIEKTEHPCQFPIGLPERLILALSNEGDTVFDPFCGVGSTGAAAALHGRFFWGCDTVPEYLVQARERIDLALSGELAYRPHDRPLYDYRTSKLSKQPKRT
jgi:adenine-specific DNA-methyltransferase